MCPKVGHFYLLGYCHMSNEEQMNPLKKPTTYQQQIEILISRGIVIHDVDKAINILKRTSYYRLTAYGLSLKQ